MSNAMEEKTSKPFFRCSKRIRTWTVSFITTANESMKIDWSTVQPCWDASDDENANNWHFEIIHLFHSLPHPVEVFLSILLSFVCYLFDEVAIGSSVCRSASSSLFFPRQRLWLLMNIVYISWSMNSYELCSMSRKTNWRMFKEVFIVFV